MKVNISQWFVVGLLSIFAGQALAHKATLKFNDQLFQGDNVIRLKQKLKQHYPQLDLRQQTLKSAYVIAKSRSNNGNVRLRVGDYTTTKTLVYGRSYNYNNPQLQTFDGIKIANTAKNSRGRWQLITQGAVKIHKIVLELEKKKSTYQQSTYQQPSHQQPAPAAGTWISGGAFKSSKHGADKRTVTINKNINELQIKASKRTSYIEKASLEMNSGFTLRLPALEGRLSKGDVKNAKLKGWRQVKRLTLVMKSGRWGKRSYVQLYVHKK